MDTTFLFMLFFFFLALGYLFYLFFRFFRRLYKIFNTKKNHSEPKIDFDLKYSTGTIIESRKWHEHGGILHIEFWVKIDDLEKRYHIINHNIEIRQKQKIQLCECKGHLIAIYNFSTKNIEYIGDEDLLISFLAHTKTPLLIKAIAISLLLVMLFKYGLSAFFLALTIILLIILFLAIYENRKRKRQALEIFNRLLNCIKFEINTP